MIETGSRVQHDIEICLVKCNSTFKKTSQPRGIFQV